MAAVPQIDPAAFWRKVRGGARHVPFLEEAVAAWFCATDPRSPARVKAAILGALAYFILPFDAVPDLLAGLGYTDDAAVLMAVLRTVAAHITDDHRDRARVALGEQVRKG